MSGVSTGVAETGSWEKRSHVQMSRGALRSIEAEVVRGGVLLETGGILLGRDAGGAGGGPLVTVAGGPGPNAIRQPLRFSRDREHADQIAERAWQDHQAVWLGEWHTHPGGSPAPSEIDMTSYGRHLSDPELGFDRFVSIIIALPADGAEPAETHARQAVLVAWLIERDGAQPVELTITKETPRG